MRFSCLLVLTLVACNETPDPAVSDEVVVTPPAIVHEATTDDVAVGADEGAEAVRRVVQDNFSSLTTCYEQQLRSHPDLSGRVEVEWTVDDGAVSDVRVHQNTTRNEVLGACIIEQVTAWRFPPEVSGDILYPFVFSHSS